MKFLLNCKLHGVFMRLALGEIKQEFVAVAQKSLKRI